MKTILVVLLNLFISLHSVLCRDFYVGMFKRNDYLVAQDNVYRAKRPYNFVQAEYGRLFKCPITYIRVVDRLGMGSGPTVKVVRGGLLKKYIAIRIKSAYNLPVSVNVYVGCENKEPRTPTRPWITSQAVTDNDAPRADNATGEESNNTKDGAEGGPPAEGGSPAEGDKPADGKPAAEGDKPADGAPPAEAGTTAGGAPAGGAPAGETPTGETPTGETPTGETPTTEPGN